MLGLRERALLFVAREWELLNKPKSLNGYLKLSLGGDLLKGKPRLSCKTELLAYKNDEIWTQRKNFWSDYMFKSLNKLSGANIVGPLGKSKWA